MTDNSGSDPTLADVLLEVKAVRDDVAKLDQRLTNEVQRWDERFFQLTRDTLNFTRAVVTTAAVVAVLVPTLKEVLPGIIDLLAGR